MKYIIYRIDDTIRQLRNSFFESLRCTNVTNMFFGPFALSPERSSAKLENTSLTTDVLKCPTNINLLHLHNLHFEIKSFAIT